MKQQLPLSENFHSIQGEATFTGYAMHFIRLAGCPVGVKATKEFTPPKSSCAGYMDANSYHCICSNYHEHNGSCRQHNREFHPPRLNILSTGIEASKCRVYSGQFFDCDTDFSCHTYKTVDELIGETWEQHICLTGGEPLIHQKTLIEQGFFKDTFAKRIQIHIETSGTVLLDPRLQHEKRIWITVAPKWNYLPEMLKLADEIKLLVDENWDEAKLPDLSRVNAKIFISPINFEKDVNHANVQRAILIQRSHPTWILSSQWHKLLSLQ